MPSSASLIAPALLLAGCAAGPAQAPLPQPAGGAAEASAALDYDEVGYATWYGEEMGDARTATGERFDPAAMTAAHRTLPLGSYAEVTALDTGHVILVRINDRGPHDPSRLIDLSRGAAQALGTDRRSMAPVRVRAILPEPADIAALRAGHAATARLDAPPPLIAALRRELGEAPGRHAPAAASVALGPSPSPLSVAPLPSHPSRAPSSAAPIEAPLPGGYYVQIAAFSSQPRAAALADRLNGKVLAATAAGLYRVRLGPFADPSKAQRARDAAAAQGYGDARVVRAP